MTCTLHSWESVVYDHVDVLRSPVRKDLLDFHARCPNFRFAIADILRRLYTLHCEQIKKKKTQKTLSFYFLLMGWEDKVSLTFPRAAV